ncbi:ATP-binding cassette domain-containing protein [Rhodobacteraceae bacterium D3-12]|nr:ATP-binding cassette domain-containing protein [Rhodobacteraceae bacterium D3-12]
MIEVSGLSFHVGQVQILHDISVTLDSGGVTALIGPNGAGKSTLLHAIAGLNAPSSGTVSIDGLDPYAAPAMERARRVALLQQFPTVVSRLRVRELIAFGRWPHHKGRATPQDDAKVEEAIKALSLEDLADRPLETLSGGQRQRAFVAMTFAQDTPWILLDEPLNALDPRHARNLMSRLKELAEETGRSIVIVLHDINAAAGWAARVVAMKDGRVMAHGATREVLSPEVLGEVFETPFDVIEHRGRIVVVAD